MPALKLTMPLIDDMKTQAADQVYWDQAFRSLGLKVTMAGHRVFIAMYRMIDGQRVRMYTMVPTAS